MTIQQQIEAVRGCIQTNVNSYTHTIGRWKGTIPPGWERDETEALRAAVETLRRSKSKTPRAPSDTAHQLILKVWAHMCGYEIDGTRMRGRNPLGNWFCLRDSIGEYLGELDRLALKASKPKLMKKIRRILKSK